jgi:hypothetical protein
VELPTTDWKNIEEEPSSLIEPVKQVAQSLFAVMPCGQGGMIVGVLEPERELNDKQNNMQGASISESYETAGGHCLNLKFESPSYDEAEPICSVGNKEQTLDKPTEKEAEKQECPDDCAESVNEEAHINPNSKSFRNTELLRSHLH